MSDVSQAAIRAALAAVLDNIGAPDIEIQLERPRDPTHGDLATNVALTLARTLKRPPRAIADEIAGALDLEAAGIDRVEVAGPGFLNFHLASDVVSAIIGEILEADESWGRGTSGSGRKVMVEYVSANPTGPLHLGHGRQAALGDAIASLFDWSGWSVHREYYYNDSGRQMDLLAQSVRARYQHALGLSGSLPEDGYRGEYVRDVAVALVDAVGDRFAEGAGSEALDAVRDFAVEMLRAEQDRDLGDFGVRFDHYFLESSLYRDGLVASTIDDLKAAGHVYEKDGATWLETTRFGDQKDRVMVRSNGMPTYFLPDVAYHMNKWSRGFRRVVNVQGSDHHGTVDRVRAGLQALGLPEGYPEYVLHQMVRVIQDGEEVKFSKRAGSGMTLRELYERVGVDVTRFFFQMRKADAHLLFDLDVALDQSDKNPVYKIQYAHARLCSIARRIADRGDGSPGAGPHLTRLEHPLERELIQQLGDFPKVIERATDHAAPHIVCDYLEHTASAVNSWYHAGNPTRNPELAVLVEDDDVRAARAALTAAARIVLRNGLTLLGITAPERMVRDDVDEGLG